MASSAEAYRAALAVIRTRSCHGERRSARLSSLPTLSHSWVVVAWRLSGTEQPVTCREGLHRGRGRGRAPCRRRRPAGPAHLPGETTALDLFGTALRRAGPGPRAAPAGHRRGRPGRHLAPNCPEWTLLQHAAAQISAILVPINPPTEPVPSRRPGTNDKSAQMIHFECRGGTRRPAGVGRRGRDLGSPWRKLGNRSRSRIPGGRHTVARYSSHARGKPS